MDPRLPLRREVQEPGPGPAARGLVVVSATAMMLALTSSTLLFWASLPGERGPRWGGERVHVAMPGPAPTAQAEPVRLSPPPPCRSARAAAPIAPAPRPLCGAPVYRSLGDGRTEVEFEACASARPIR